LLALGVAAINACFHQEWAVNGPLLAFLAVPREGGNGSMILLMQFVAIGFIFYFLLIRPQRKEQQRHREMIEQLKKGDEVITAGGIIGTVVHTQDDRITIKSGENTRVVIQRGRVAQVLSDKAPE
jgi:preprotein translocase subunit YajC